MKKSIRQQRQDKIEDMIKEQEKQRRIDKKVKKATNPDELLDAYLN